MNPYPPKRYSSTDVWISIGAGLFLVALAVSALAVPQLRLLHLLQAFIYVAVVILARRNNVYALGAGFTIAVAWNCRRSSGLTSCRRVPSCLVFSAYRSGPAA